jgi:hypothetical protein
LPVGAVRCDCGHSFESNGPSGTSAEELSLRDEELYENYLIARATQAQQAADAAQDALAEDPGNPDKMSAAELAREVARSIESDLAEQRLKVGALRAVVRTAIPAAPTPPVLPATSRPAVATPATRPVQAAPNARHKPAATPAPPKPAATPSATLQETITVPRQAAAAALEAIKKAKAREMLARPHETSPAPRGTPVPAPTAVNSHQPTRPADLPTLSNVPPQTFRAQQAAKAEKVMGVSKPAVAVEGKECPNCTASVPTATTRCRCGFAFVSSGNDMPTLTLCTGDFTALRNSLNLHLRDRT